MSLGFGLSIMDHFETYSKSSCTSLLPLITGLEYANNSQEIMACEYALRLNEMDLLKMPIGQRI